MDGPLFFLLKFCTVISSIVSTPIISGRTFSVILIPNFTIKIIIIYLGSKRSKKAMRAMEALENDKDNVLRKAEVIKGRWKDLATKAKTEPQGNLRSI